MAEWRPFPEYEAYHVALYDGDQLVRVHPIPFDSKREAERAADRLNVKQAIIESEQST